MTTTTYTTREAWLEARQAGIGASDAAAVLDLSQWTGPLALYCEKLGIAPLEAAEVEALEWGLALQAPIAARYARETKRTVIDPGPYTIHHSAEHPFMLATLDGLVDDPARGRGVLEIKTTGAWHADAWADGEAPLPYQIQVQHQLAVTGLAWGSLAVLVGGQKFYWLDVDRNQAFIDALIAREREFWARVEQRDPPPPDASESCRDLLKRLYPRDTPGAVVALPPAAAAWDATRREAKAALEVAAAACREAENQIIAAIGDAAVGILPDGTRYTYKAQTRKAYTVADTTFRVLRRSAAK